MILVFAISLNVNAQSSFGIFKEGIYYSHLSLQKNTPSVSFDSLLVSNRSFEVKLHTSPRAPNTIFRVRTKIDGRKKYIDISKVWAFCCNGVLYLNIDNKLVRVIKFGAICHLTIENVDYKLTDKSEARLNLGGLRSGRPEYVEEGYSSNQYILDFQNGELFPFTLENFEPILKRDAQLYERFQKEDNPFSMFRYLIAYNKRNPLKIG